MNKKILILLPILFIFIVTAITIYSPVEIGVNYCNANITSSQDVTNATQYSCTGVFADCEDGNDNNTATFAQINENYYYQNFSIGNGQATYQALVYAIGDMNVECYASDSWINLGSLVSGFAGYNMGFQNVSISSSCNRYPLQIRTYVSGIPI
jgi:hypothetical protein